MKRELTDLKAVVDDWPDNAPKAILKRKLKSDVQVVGGGDVVAKVHSRIQTCAPPGDDPNKKFDPLDPKLCHMSLDASERMALCLELDSNHVLHQFIDQGLAAKEQLLTALVQLHEQLDEDSSNTINDEYDDIFEGLHNRIKGTVAFVSREFGKLHSKQSHAKALQQEASVMVNSLYNSLVNNDDYKTLVAEYWSTIDASEKFMPAVNKPQSSSPELL